MPNTMRLPTSKRNHGNAIPLRKVHEDRLKRRAGGAYARLQAKGRVLADALSVDHSTISHRKSGMGGLANVLLEISAWERQGIDTGPLVEALIATQQEARMARGEVLCLATLSQEEAALDGEEDMGQIEFHRTGCIRRWQAAYLAKLAFAKSKLLPAMMEVGR